MSRRSLPVPLSHIVATPLVRALPILVLALAATTAMAAEKVLDRTFSVAPGGVINVNADGASIVVKGNDSAQVVVHMVAKGSQRDLDDMKLSATQGEGSIDIELKRPGSRGWFDFGSWNSESRIEVTAPRSFKVQAKTSGGSVRLESVAGPSRLRTSGGSISARDVKGDLEGYTSGGSVTLESIEGSVVARTSGGSVVANSVRGSIEAGTSGGSVRLQQIDGKIRAETSGGGIQCELIGANRGIYASTSGGGIHLTVPKDVSGMLDAASSGGSISTDIPVSTTTVAQHRLTGAINGGGETIFARTSGGSISLSVK